MRLTDRAVAQLPLLETGQRRIRDDLLPGFGITVGTRRKTFFVMHGKDRRLQTLGHYPAVSLQDARSAARAILADPEPIKPGTSLTELVKAYIAAITPTLRPSSVYRYQNALKNAPDILVRKVDTTVATTPKEIAVYKSLFNWAIQNGYVGKNPFAYTKARYGQRSRILSDDELKTLWGYDRQPYSAIIRCLILSGQRVNQFGRFDPSWVRDDVITFPATIMKSGREHTIPLTPLLKENLPRATWNGWSKAKQLMDEATGVSGYVLHDLRRTFATIHARLGTPIHVIEAQLDHSSGTISGVAALYIRHNWLGEMREAMRRYEFELNRITGG